MNLIHLPLLFSCCLQPSCSLSCNRTSLPSISSVLPSINQVLECRTLTLPEPHGKLFQWHVNVDFLVLVLLGVHPFPALSGSSVYFLSCFRATQTHWEKLTKAKLFPGISLSITSAEALLLLRNLLTHFLLSGLRSSFQTFLSLQKPWAQPWAHTMQR